MIGFVCVKERARAHPYFKTIGLDGLKSKHVRFHNNARVYVRSLQYVCQSRCMMAFDGARA